MNSKFYIPKFLGVYLLALLFLSASAEGTKEVMGSSGSGTALYISNDIGQGSYLNAPVQNRIYFRIFNHVSENLYFGLRPISRTETPAVRNDVYYKIYDPWGNLVKGPLKVGNTGLGAITSYAAAVAGPKIKDSQGYDAISFDPIQNGDYYIEIYPSTDNGATQITSVNSSLDAGAPTICIWFDFTVGKNDGTTYTGRVHSQNWSFITYNTSTNEGSQSVSYQGSVYGLTSDNVVNKVTFNNGFNPLAFVVAMNSYGITNTGNFESDRNSVVSGSSAPVLNNSYKVFINQPDAMAFPVAAIPAAPQVNGGFNGCPGDYIIPYTVAQSGDIRLLLNFNGIPGYQAGSADRYLYRYGVPAGINMMHWDGKDGFGATVSNNATVQFSLSLLKGRTNLPLFDAELNSNGLSVSSVSPQANANLMMYWNDANLTSSGTTCDNTSTNKNNNLTGAGIDNSIEGMISPAHAWDGAGAGIAVPAPFNNNGSATDQTCDDFGNVRTINTWFWGLSVTSGMYNLPLPSCNSSLPVRFISVNGTAAGNRADISWKVAEETNVAYYAVERRSETGTFKKIGQVNANPGMDLSKEYSFIDAGISEGQPYYYRIKEVDNDRQSYYSNIVRVSPLNRVAALSVSSNPITAAFSVQVNAGIPQRTEVVITSMDGKVIMSKPVSISAGKTLIPLNEVSGMVSSGVYLLTMRIDDKMHYIKLIK